MIYQIRNLQSGHPYLIPPGTVLIGRNDDANVSIEHETISRRHANLYNATDGVWIEDLNSSNGTIVRGEMITQKTLLQPGEVFHIGQVDFLLEPETHEESNPPEVAPPPQISWDNFRRKTHKLPRREIMTQVPALSGLTRKAPSVAAVSQFSPPPPAPRVISESSADEKPLSFSTAVPWKLIIGLAVGAGMALGLIIGLLMAKLFQH